MQLLQYYNAFYNRVVNYFDKFPQDFLIFFQIFKYTCFWVYVQFKAKFNAKNYYVVKQQFKNFMANFSCQIKVLLLKMKTLWFFTDL